MISEILQLPKSWVEGFEFQTFERLQVPKNWVEGFWISNSNVWSFRFMGGIRREGIFDFFHVPNVFIKNSLSSQCVPQKIPNSTTGLSHMFCPKFTPFSSM